MLYCAGQHVDSSKQTQLLLNHFVCRSVCRSVKLALSECVTRMQRPLLGSRKCIASVLLYVGKLHCPNAHTPTTKQSGAEPKRSC